MKAEHLTNRMREYNAEVAPGSECEAWQDYVADFTSEFGSPPWDKPEIHVPQNFADYWVDVSNGFSDEYFLETGGRTS